MSNVICLDPDGQYSQCPDDTVCCGYLYCCGEGTYCKDDLMCVKQFSEKGSDFTPFTLLLIVIGSVLVIIILIFLIYKYCKRLEERRQQQKITPFTQELQNQTKKIIQQETVVINTDQSQNPILQIQSLNQTKIAKSRGRYQENDLDQLDISKNIDDVRHYGQDTNNSFLQVSRTQNNLSYQQINTKHHNQNLPERRRRVIKSNQTLTNLSAIGSPKSQVQQTRVNKFIDNQQGQYEQQAQEQEDQDQQSQIQVVRSQNQIGQSQNNLTHSKNRIETVEFSQYNLDNSKSIPPKSRQNID